MGKLTTEATQSTSVKDKLAEFVIVIISSCGLIGVILLYLFVWRKIGTTTSALPRSLPVIQQQTPGVFSSNDNTYSGPMYVQPNKSAVMPVHLRKKIVYTYVWLIFRLPFWYTYVLEPDVNPSDILEALIRGNYVDVNDTANQKLMRIDPFKFISNHQGWWNSVNFIAIPPVMEA